MVHVENITGSEVTEKTQNTIFRVIFEFLLRDKKQRYQFLFIFITIVLTAVLSSAVPVLFSYGIDQLGHNVGSNYGVILIAAFAGGLMLSSVLMQLQWVIFSPMNLRLQRHLTVHVLDHTLSLPYYVLKQRNSHELGRIVEKGLQAVWQITYAFVFTIAPTLMELGIAASVIGVLIDPWIAVVLFAALLLYGYVANISASQIKQTTETAMRGEVSTWNFGHDAIVNMEQVQQSNLRGAILDRFNSQMKSNNSEWNTTFVLRAKYGVIQALIFGSVVLWVLWRGASDVAGGVMTIGELVLINTYIVRLLQPVETLARIHREVHASSGQASLLMDLLAEKPTRSADRSDLAPANQPWTLEARGLDVLIGHNRLIGNLDFAVPAGRRMFVVGPSGIGKSSLLKILAGLVPPPHGEYRINGVALNEDNAASLRSGIAVVQQDCLLFNWSLMDNVTIGSEASEQDIRTIFSALGLNEIERRHREDGAPTLGERGNRLSGGEKQRVSLARALLRQPKILLLDEPTAALDEINRRRVTNLLKTRLQNCTTIVVTHDIDLIAADDHVLYIGGAERHFTGVHGELLRTSDEYRSFVSGQIEETVRLHAVR